MRVEIWSEITCLWCGLGSHRLDRAVERFEHGEEVEVIHRSFPLSDGVTVGSTISVREAMSRKYGLADARLEASARQIEAMAEQEGLSPYRVLDKQVSNTRLAHQFLAHASAEGKNHGRVLTEGSFDGRYALSGAQDTDTLLGILHQVWDETHPTVLVADNDAAICGPDGCAVPAAHA
ncbi:DsbA family protein [Nonomuraea sp. NPDC049714]|uniref:DsbA family protein n=1 Tax=Nonomuraea sp. NPDC049714 TaxID=3364357 RepID=UPI00378833B9